MRYCDFRSEFRTSLIGHLNPNLRTAEYRRIERLTPVFVQRSGAFAVDTLLGSLHGKDVGARWYQVRDFRSYTTRTNTLGTDVGGANDGIRRSLQIDVGTGVDYPQPNDRSNQSATGYADLDCANPAQDVLSAIRHFLKF